MATRVMAAQGDQWVGPIASVYGWHLVRGTAHRPERRPPLSEIRARVAEDWAAGWRTVEVKRRLDVIAGQKTPIR